MLDDNDHKQIALTLENAVLKGFDQHRKEQHEPLEFRLDAVERKIWKWGGGIAVILAAVPFLLKLL